MWPSYSPFASTGRRNSCGHATAPPGAARRGIMHSRQRLITAALLLALARAVHAGFPEGLDAAEREDFASALRHGQPLAIQGHAPSQFNLALMYEAGQGVPRDLVLAAYW